MHRCRCASVLLADSSTLTIPSISFVRYATQQLLLHTLFVFCLAVTITIQSLADLSTLPARTYLPGYNSSECCSSLREWLAGWLLYLEKTDGLQFLVLQLLT
jgi:hypothetical protein